jgi:Uma2 family endonuclease
MGMAAPLYYTAEMVRALPEDGRRYEVVHGELLVTPAPRLTHQLVLARLFEELAPWLRRHPVGRALWSPADISWGPDVLVQPDLFVVRMDEARQGEWRHVRHLLLVVEVLSPSTARADRFTKRRLYQEVGVPHYWIVDAEARAVEVWTPDAALPQVERARLTWQPDGTGEPFTLELDALFREP